VSCVSTGLSVRRGRRFGLVHDVVGDGLGLRESNEVTAGPNVGVDTEAILGDVPLEVGGEEAIVGADEHAGRDGGPRLEVARRREDGVAFGTLAVLTGDNNLGGNVVQEIRVQVEVAVSSSGRGSSACFDRAGVPSRLTSAARSDDGAGDAEMASYADVRARYGLD
jgi:hypothetical protein